VHNYACICAYECTIIDTISNRLTSSVASSASTGTHIALCISTTLNRIAMLMLTTPCQLLRVAQVQRDGARAQTSVLYRALRQGQRRSDTYAHTPSTLAKSHAHHTLQTQEVVFGLGSGTGEKGDKDEGKNESSEVRLVQVASVPLFLVVWPV
jgi:hypothetical protein